MCRTPGFELAPKPDIERIARKMTPSMAFEGGERFCCHDQRSDANYHAAGEELVPVEVTEVAEPQTRASKAGSASAGTA